LGRVGRLQPGDPPAVRVEGDVLVPEGGGLLAAEEFELPRRRQGDRTGGEVDEVVGLQGVGGQWRFGARFRIGHADFRWAPAATAAAGRESTNRVGPPATGT